MKWSDFAWAAVYVLSWISGHVWGELRGYRKARAEYESRPDTIALRARVATLERKLREAESAVAAEAGEHDVQRSRAQRAESRLAKVCMAEGVMFRRVVSECAITMRSRCSCHHCDEMAAGWTAEGIIAEALRALSSEGAS